MCHIRFDKSDCTRNNKEAKYTDTFINNKFIDHCKKYTQNCLGRCPNKLH